MLFLLCKIEQKVLRCYTKVLGTSPSLLTFGKSVAIPGQLLGYPGPPPESEATKELLEDLYKMSAQPALQTSTTVNPI